MPGDLCRVSLPGGEERHAVVLQAAETAVLLPTLLVVPLTHDLQSLRLPGTVPVEPDDENRLERAEVAVVFQLTAVDAARVTRASGRLSGPLLARLYEELDRLTGARRALS
jgi:mRNA-degrading endonuclease toxin of MazEF toxin-antitoxin module